MTITLLNLCLNTSSLLPTNPRAVGSCSTPTIANSPLTILFEVFSVAGRETALQFEYKFQLWHTKERMISSRSICFRPGNRRVQENRPKMLRISTSSTATEESGRYYHKFINHKLLSKQEFTSTHLHGLHKLLQNGRQHAEGLTDDETDNFGGQVDSFPVALCKKKRRRV